MSLLASFSLSPEAISLAFDGRGIGPYDNIPGFYGNWGGPGNPVSIATAAPPVDAMDALFMAHDMNTSYGDDPAGSLAADRALYDGIQAIEPDSAYGRFYKDAVLLIFGARLGEYGLEVSEVASPAVVERLGDLLF